MTIFRVARINTFEQSLWTWAFAPKARVPEKRLLLARERRGPGAHIESITEASYYMIHIPHGFLMISL